MSSCGLPEMEGKDEQTKQQRPALQKEKISIIAASVFVLSALTLAGVYMSAQGDRKKEENRIDFAKLEQENITSEEGDASLPDTRFVSGKAESDLEAKRKAQTDSRYIDPDIYDLSDNNDMDVIRPSRRQIPVR